MHSFIHKNPIVLVPPGSLVEPYNWVEHIPFALFFTKTFQPKVIVELGVHTGNSFKAFCQAVKLENLSTQCYGIDLWQGDEHAGFYNDDIYLTISNTIQSLYSSFAQLIRKDFNDAVHDFEDSSIDLLHIDGLHSYEAVKNDFEVWLPKMSKRGVVLFHDTQVKERGFGVFKFWSEISKIHPHYEFKFGNGLGVLAVGREVDHHILEFLKELQQNQSIAKTFQYIGSKIFHEAEVKRLREKIKKDEEKRLKNYYVKHPFLYVSKLLRGKL